MEKRQVLDQLLLELHRSLLILDKENLSGNATVQKSLLSDLLQTYRRPAGGDEEYIYMNKVVVSENKDDRADGLENGKAGKFSPVPQKNLPELPPPRTGLIGREPFPLPRLPAAAIDTSESYYEEAQPYEEAVNDDGEAVSSSYESYDEEEVTKGKCPSAQHQWPSAEAPFELMRDSRICAFLWRKKWLGQWAKQLCVIRDDRLMCYKSSKEQTPLLDVSLLGCSVVYKEKQLKRKEHRLKIVPVGGETIVLGLQSREQTEQWLKVIQEISPRPTENGDSQQCASDSPRLICTKLGDRYSVASESGSSTDSHTETYENKDVKKKFQFSNLMNIGKKKPLSLESSGKCIDTSGYLNVLVNSQWRTCWCLIKNRQLWFYQDKSKSKISQPAVSLEGCSVCPDPSPEHLYSFRIQSEGTQLTTLEAKTSADMGHWLGLLLSQTASKTSPEDLTYDYVNAERISSIVSAAKTSLYLMQRRYSEPNTYIDTPPSFSQNSEELYDDVASLADPEEVEETESLHNEDTPTEKDTSENSDTYESVKSTNGTAEDADSSIYLDLIPVRSFLHTSGKNSPAKDTVTVPEPTEEHREPKEVGTPTPSETVPVLNEPNNPEEPSQTQVPSQPQEKTLKSLAQSQESPRRGTVGQISKSFLSPAAPGQSSTGHQSPQTPRAKNMNGAERPKAYSVGSHGTVEGKLGKNRTEADLRKYRDEREHLEREREEVRSSLANLKKERSEVKEELTACQDPKQQAALEARLKQRDEACREAERRRVEVELQLVEVKENLKKAESGPFTLGTTLDLQDTPKTATLPPPSVHLSTSSSPCQTAKASNGTVSGDPGSPVNSASVLKNRPASIMATKGKVLQKAKEWEKMSTT